jgi:hypothetical protein
MFRHEITRIACKLSITSQKCQSMYNTISKIISVLILELYIPCNHCVEALNFCSPESPSIRSFSWVDTCLWLQAANLEVA